MESHSAALFVTSNISANTCMDDRLQSRFHVCLQLPDLTSATRGQIWQKCLESHKDISFFANSDALAGWTLNGREIANAVVAAKTLATNGVVEMRHLERVVPAGKRPFPVVDDFWGVPPKKDKQKKSRKVALDRHPVDVVEVVEEPPKREVADVLAGWGFGTPKDKKGKTKTAMEPGKGPEVYLEEDDWNCWAVKEDRKAKRSSDEAAVPPPPSPPSEAEIPAKGTIEVDDGWGSFGVKKDKKKKKKGMTATATEPEAAVAEPKKDSETPAAAPVEVDEWDFWAASKKSKKGKKKPIPLLDDAPPAIEGQAPAASVVASCYSPPTSPTTEERYWNCHGCVDLDP